MTSPLEPDNDRDGNQPELLQVAVLISGGGRTLKNLIDLRAQSLLPIDIQLVISSRGDAGGLRHAEAAGISHQVVRRGGQSAAAYRDAVFGACRESGASAVVMAGFLKHVLIPPDFALRVLNIHPSLIPSFCGQGFYGERVHQAVLDAGVKLTGCTVHFVDDQFDHGPIILQRAVPVLDDDDASSLAARVFEAECAALPDALRLLAAGRLSVVEGRVLIG